jgi:hypothetical protein
LGAAELVQNSGHSPEELRRMVVTPGGTTAAGLAVMEREKTPGGLSAAVEAAAARVAKWRRKMNRTRALIRARRALHRSAHRDQIQTCERTWCSNIDNPLADRAPAFCRRYQGVLRWNKSCRKPSDAVREECASAGESLRFNPAKLH